VLYTGLAAGPAMFGSSIGRRGFGVGFALCGTIAATLAIIAFVMSYVGRKRNKVPRTVRMKEGD
jgi:hypothetical protein